MNKYDIRKRKRELDKLYQKPANRRLKYLAVGFAVIAIALMIAMILLIDSLSWRTMMLLRGCTGLSAIIFVALTGVLVYRVNREYYKERFS